jgi:hypothetical protein
VSLYECCVTSLSQSFPYESLSSCVNNHFTHVAFDLARTLVTSHVGGVPRGRAAWTPCHELDGLRAGDTGRGICGRRRETLLLAAEHLAAGQGGETDTDVGAAEPAERSRGHEYGIADAGQVEVFPAGVRNYSTNRAVHSYADV